MLPFELKPVKGRTSNLGKVSGSTEEKTKSIFLSHAKRQISDLFYSIFIDSLLALGRILLSCFFVDYERRQLPTASDHCSSTCPSYKEISLKNVTLSIRLKMDLSKCWLIACLLIHLFIYLFIYVPVVSVRDH